MPETAAPTGKVKNVSGESLIDSWSGGRLVLDGATLEVPVDQVYAYTQQAERWAPHDNHAKKAHKEGAEARESADAGELAIGAQFVDAVDTTDTPPASAADQNQEV